MRGRLKGREGGKWDNRMTTTPQTSCFILQTGSPKQLKRWQDAPEFTSNSRLSEGGWLAGGPLSPSEPIWSGGLRTLRWHEKARPRGLDPSIDRNKEQEQGGGRTRGMWALVDVLSCLTHLSKSAICRSTRACLCLDSHLQGYGGGMCEEPYRMCDMMELCVCVCQGK